MELALAPLAKLEQVLPRVKTLGALRCSFRTMPGLAPEAPGTSKSFSRLNFTSKIDLTIFSRRFNGGD